MEHLHDYKIIKETSDGIFEVCNTCKKTLITKKGNRGRIDNRKYLKEHERDFLQPNNPKFEREWGKPNYGETKK